MSQDFCLIKRYNFISATIISLIATIRIGLEPALPQQKMLKSYIVARLIEKSDYLIQTKDYLIQKRRKEEEK